MTIIFAIASTPLAGSAIPEAYFPGAAAFDEEAELLTIAQEWSRGELDHQGRYKDAPPATWGINKRGDTVDTDAEIEKLFGQNNLDRGRTATFGTIVELAKQGGYQPAQMPPPVEQVAPAPKKPANRFLAALRKKPSELASRPAIEYLDEAKTIARVPEVITVVAPRSNHKTGLLLKLALDAHERGLKVLFIAVEDGYAVSTTRIPAYLRARELPSDHLDQGRWVTMEESFNFLRDMPTLVEACREMDFKPDVTFVDVFAKAASGANFDSSKDAAILMSSAIDMATVFNSPVVVSAHPRRNSETGQVSGSHLFGDLAYGELQVRIVGGKLRVKIAKNKNGPADYTVWYKIGAEPGTGIPIIGDQTEAPVQSEATQARGAVIRQIEEMMTFMRARGMTEPVTDREMAVLMSGNDADHPETTKVWERIRKYHAGEDGQRYMWQVGRSILGNWHWQLSEYHGDNGEDMDF